jgi:hypothetical protein
MGPRIPIRHVSFLLQVRKWRSFVLRSARTNCCSMGQPKCRKKQAAAKNKQYKKGHATKNRRKDLDQIQDEIQLNHVGRLPQPLDADLPGMGQFRCLECSRFFISSETLIEHQRSKFHKKQAKRVLDPMYSQADAELAAGMGPVQNSRSL